MSHALNTLVLVPARMASTRLPNKPLAEIEGLPMVVQVVRRGEEAGLGPVVVAAAEPEIVAAVEAAGGRAILTDPAHPSGSDRIFEALNRLDPEGRVEAIINLQGDLPAIEPSTIKAALEPLRNESVDIATLATPIKEAREINDPNVVKAVVSFQPEARIGRALYFTRATAPSGEGPLLHHIGLYAYRRKALERFVKLPPSPLEKRERLEQLRALEAGMRIDVALVDTLPLGVDTPEDLERIRALMRNRSPRAFAT